MEEHNSQERHRDGLENTLNSKKQTNINIPAQLSQFYHSTFTGSLVAFAEISYNQPITNPIFISGSLGIASGIFANESNNYNTHSRFVKGLASAAGYLTGYITVNLFYKGMFR